MKRWTLFPLVVALFATGCAPQTEPETPTTSQTENAAKPRVAKLSTTQELAKYCRVCVVDKGEKIEEFFPSRLDTKHGGQTYKFCADDCKKKFDANSKRYALK